MTELESSQINRINPFVSSLSVVNFFFSFSMNLFNYTIFYLLYQLKIPIIYGGIGTTIGQIAILIITLPQGRFIDKGFSYFLMMVGGIIYSTALILIFFDSLIRAIIFFYIMAVLVAVILISQNTFKSALSSFVGKSIKSSVIGSHYSRIIVMETAGGTVALFTIAFILDSIGISHLYLISGAVLVAAVVSSFTFLFRRERENLVTEESLVKRPTFIGSIRALKNRKKFIVPVISTKVFMSVGIYAFSYYYIILGLKLGISSFLSLIFLALSYTVGIIWGYISGKFIDRHKGWGKLYVILMALFDLVMYALMFYALYARIPDLYLGSALIGSIGPFVVPGALSYELKVVGKENRGMYGSIQRITVAIAFILIGVPLAYLVSFNYIYMWSVVVAAAIISFISAILIPSKTVTDEIMKSSSGI
ncbi:MFS transporter [Oxyplasma meridianum]|uniref:MFS transporter n=1 Tax=Oxyplasma meridianum TaxID=3073602 RepID=A0AAX4NHV8_9ARCH